MLWKPVELDIDQGLDSERQFYMISHALDLENHIYVNSLTHIDLTTFLFWSSLRSVSNNASAWESL